MKRVASLLLVSLLMGIPYLSTHVVAAGDNPIDSCGTQGVWQAPQQTGGIWLPASGTVRALVVFVQFRGDRYDTSNGSWPAGQLPTWASSVLYPTVQSSYPDWTLSDYFKEMSLGSCDLVGDVYPSLVITAQTESS